MLDAQLLVLDLIRSLRPVVERLRVADVDLAKQIMKATNSVAANLAEGEERRGADRRRVYRLAAAEAKELRTALEVAAAWGHLDAEALAPARALANRVGAVTHVLAR